MSNMSGGIVDAISRRHTQLLEGYPLRADVLQQAVDAERDERRRGHAQSDDPEHAARGRETSAVLSGE